MIATVDIVDVDDVERRNAEPRVTQPQFAEAVTVERRGIIVTEARVPGGSERLLGGSVFDLPAEVAQPAGAEAVMWRHVAQVGVGEDRQGALVLQGLK
jgi:hypothetical protein